MKEARALGNYIRVAPRKARAVIDLIRGLSVDKALGVLNLSRKNAAHPIRKVLESAMANATANKDMKPGNLVVRKAFVDEGPTLKRYRSRAMGRATVIRKRTSRIMIFLAEQEEEGQAKAPEKKVRKGIFARKRERSGNK